MEFNYVDFPAKIFVIPAEQNRFIEENNFNKAPVCQIASAMKKNSAFTESIFENPCWYQQFDLRQNRDFGGRRSFVNFDATNN